MGLWFMGYSKIESIKNPANHLIIRSTGSDKWGLRFRIMLRVYGLWVYRLFKILRAFKNPTNHLIIRITACPDWTHVRIQTKRGLG